jgi:hypothetical protein
VQEMKESYQPHPLHNERCNPYKQTEHHIPNTRHRIDTSTVASIATRIEQTKQTQTIHRPTGFR